MGMCVFLTNCHSVSLMVSRAILCYGRVGRTMSLGKVVASFGGGGPVANRSAR